MGSFAMWIFLCLFISMSGVNSLSKEKILYLREYEPCDHPKSVIVLKDCQVNSIGGGKSSLSGILDVNRAIKTFSKVTFKLYRCPSFSEKDKCEFVVKFNFQGDVCNKLKDRNQFWSNYIFAIKPDFKCPVLKGEYKVTNATFNPATFEALTSGVDQYYWRVHVHALDGKESVLCMLFGGEVRKIKAEK